MKRKENKFLTLLLLMSIPLHTSCGGGNLYGALTTETTKQKAEDDINSGNYTASINLLSPYVAANPNDQEAIGLLTTSYLLQAGVNLLNIMISILSASGSAKNNFQAILSAMPTGSQTNITLLTNAVNTITLISASKMNADQSYLYAVASASLAILIIKGDCLNSSGTISTSATNAMSTADANSVYTNLNNANTAFTSAGISSNSTSGSGMIAGIINQINSSTGASNSAKVINYIISQE